MEFREEGTAHTERSSLSRQGYLRAGCGYVETARASPATPTRFRREASPGCARRRANIIQPRARRSASAGYEVATNLPAAEAAGTTLPNSQQKRDPQQLLWRPPPRPPLPHSDRYPPLALARARGWIAERAFARARARGSVQSRLVSGEARLSLCG